MQPRIGVVDRTVVQVEPDERQVRGGRIRSAGRTFQRSGERPARVAVSAGGQVEAAEEQRRARIGRVTGIAGQWLKNRLRAVEFAQLQSHPGQGEAMLRTRRLAGRKQDLRLRQAAAQLRVPRRVQIGRKRRPHARGRRQRRSERPPYAYRRPAARHLSSPRRRQDGVASPLPFSVGGWEAGLHPGGPTSWTSCRGRTGRSTSRHRRSGRRRPMSAPSRETR